SERCSSASGLPRRQIAITRASVTSCAVIAALIDQLDMRRRASVVHVEPRNQANLAFVASPKWGREANGKPREGRPARNLAWPMVGAPRLICRTGGQAARRRMVEKRPPDDVKRPGLPALLGTRASAEPESVGRQSS